MNEEVAQRWARAVLKGELGKASVTYAELAERLRNLGFEETEPSVRNKISRGTFSAAFLGACLEVLNVELLRIDLLDFGRRHESAPQTLYGLTAAEVTQGERRTRLPWSFSAPSASFEPLPLPDARYQSERKNAALVCGNCETVLFAGWLISQAVKAFDGAAVVGRCNACRAFIDLPGASVHLSEQAP